jgi:hypothetical protein
MSLAVPHASTSAFPNFASDCTNIGSSGRHGSKTRRRTPFLSTTVTTRPAASSPFPLAPRTSSRAEKRTRNERSQARDAYASARTLRARIRARKLADDKLGRSAVPLPSVRPLSPPVSSSSLLLWLSASPSSAAACSSSAARAQDRVNVRRACSASVHNNP